MADFGVTLKKIEALTQKMRQLGIRQEDISEKFLRSSGPGGQNVNKVSTCVQIKHIPSGIEVKYSKERSQALNRYCARQLLAKKIEEKILGKVSQEQKRISKIRRQKRRRSRRTKLKLLELKRRRSEKKSFRAKVNEGE